MKTWLYSTDNGPDVLVEPIDDPKTITKLDDSKPLKNESVYKITITPFAGLGAFEFWTRTRISAEGYAKMFIDSFHGKERFDYVGCSNEEGVSTMVALGKIFRSAKV